jgi:hypothetical protein
MNDIKNLIVACGLGLAFSGATVMAGHVDISKLPAPASEDGVTFEKDISPMLKASCGNCHTGEKPKAGLHLDSIDGVLKGSKEGKVVVPGKSAQSVIVIAASGLDPDNAMPPKGKKHPGGPGGPPPQDGPQVQGGPGSGGPGPGGPGGPGHSGPPPKPLTAEQVGLLRAWIDQGAK